MKGFCGCTSVFLAAMLASFAVSAAMSPETVSGVTTIDGAQAKAMFDRGVLFVDPRKDSDWEAGRIPGAVHLDVKKGFLSEESLSAEVGKDEEIVFYCNGVKCMLSSESCEKAVNWGFSKVYYYRSGFPDWKSRGYPVE